MPLSPKKPVPHLPPLTSKSNIIEDYHGTSVPDPYRWFEDVNDRVVPSHSKKFIAELLANSAGNAPRLLRIDLKAGHKLGKPIYKLIDEHADVLTFAVHTGCKRSFIKRCYNTLLP